MLLLKLGMKMSQIGDAEVDRTSEREQEGSDRHSGDGEQHHTHQSYNVICTTLRQSIKLKYLPWSQISNRYSTSHDQWFTGTPGKE